MEILSSTQMSKADSETIKSGIQGLFLMENAGKSVSDFIKSKYNKQKTLVLCGPGNNGGDGFVVARHLKESGWDVKISSLIDKNSYKNDALVMAKRWNDFIIPFEEISVGDYSLIIDAIFGIGLSKEISGTIASVINEVNNKNIDTISIDIPSGIDSNNGAILGTAFKSKYTITFARKKIGHTIYPGKDNCGEVIISDIGIKDNFIKSNIFENTPELWINDFPFPKPQQHKYDRGHSIIVGGNVESAGAATLSAISALKTGSGLVTVACPPSALLVYASKLTAVMNKPIDSVNSFSSFIDDKRVTSVLIGPGNGVTKTTKEYVLEALKLKKNCVFDADALNVFQDKPEELFKSIYSDVILTPHEGEFHRLFALEGNKIDRAIQAAKISNCIIVLKGSDTIIAAPNGKVAVNTNAPASLATAGSGDCLAGIITALLANKVDAFKAACIGVWLHSESANLAGPGMTAEDILENIHIALQGLYSQI
jgi:hydroxyethylthiazole kinase-like uncharacterized protein yjeF